MLNTLVSWLSGACDKTAKVWDLRDPSKPVRTFIGHTEDVNSVAFFPGGNAIGTSPFNQRWMLSNAIHAATGSEDGSSKLWDIRVNQAINTYGAGEGQSPATSIAFSNRSVSSKH